MANLLLNPTNWEDLGLNSPPECAIDGRYEIHKDPSVEWVFWISLTIEAAPGDTIEGGFTFSSEYADPLFVNVVKNGFGGGVVHSASAAAAGSIDYEITEAGYYSVIISLAADDPNEVSVYGMQFVLDPDAPPLTSYNCECDDENDNKTLADLRADLMRRLGFGAQVANPPPGMADLLNSFLQGAQESLYRRYDVLRTERFFSWPLVEGVRLYDLPENQEECTKRLDPRKITWAGVDRDGVWYPLICGIPPELYSHQVTGQPARYEIRQCIELWPTPDDSIGNLVIKGRFGLEPFTADGNQTTIDSHAVFLLALANAKAHYRQPDANNYVAQLETYMQNVVAGAHQTRRYIPGRDHREDYVYVRPKPTVPFP